MRGPEHAPTVLALYETVCVVVCARFRISTKKLLVSRSRGRGGPGFARQVAMYLLNVQGVSLAEVGHLFGGRAKNSARHACAVVEDARDEPEFDATIEALETAVFRRIKTNGRGS